MTTFQPRIRQYRARVQARFDRETALRELGASLQSIEPGHIRIDLHRSDEETSVGIITAALACACELAAVSLARAGAEIVPVEHKVNFTTPKQEGPLQAYGSVVRSGATITVCRGVIISADERRRPVAHMLATFISEAPGESAPR